MNSSFDSYKVLADFVKQYGLDFSENEKEMLEIYYRLLIDTNEKMNLTAITDHDEVVIKHFLDSLAILHSVNFDGINSCIDVGTGAGFPGIPIKIFFPKLQMTLLDSLNKRVSFLNEVIRELNLNSIIAEHGRAEDKAAVTAYREKYDLCVSRAVSNLSTLAEYCLPFVKPGGIFAAYKSDSCEDEVKKAENAIRILGGEIVKFDCFKIANVDTLENLGRSIIVIRKVKNTPKKYPRKAGVPKKEPLI